MFIAYSLFILWKQKDIKVVMCGPPLMNKAMQGHLEGLGYAQDQMFIF